MGAANDETRLGDALILASLAMVTAAAPPLVSHTGPAGQIGFTADGRLWVGRGPFEVWDIDLGTVATVETPGRLLLGGPQPVLVWDDGWQPIDAQGRLTGERVPLPGPGTERSVAEDGRGWLFGVHELVDGPVALRVAPDGTLRERHVLDGCDWLEGVAVDADGRVWASCDTPRIGIDGGTRPLPWRGRLTMAHTGRVATVSTDRALLAVDPRTEAVRWQRPGRVHHVAFSPDATAAAVVEGGGEVAVLDVRTGAERLRLDALALGSLSGDRRRVAWSPDGARIAVTTGAAISLYDAITGAALTPDLAHPGGGIQVAAAANGAFAVSGDALGHRFVWHRDGRVVAVAPVPALPSTRRMWNSPPVAVGGLAVSRDGRVAASAHLGGFAAVFDARTGRAGPVVPLDLLDLPEAVFEVGDEWILGCSQGEDPKAIPPALSDDGAHLLTAGWGPETAVVRLWDARTGAALDTWWFSPGVSAVTFAADGTPLVRAGSPVVRLGPSPVVLAPEDAPPFPVREPAGVEVVRGRILFAAP
jgi:WD40 repeat protein